MQVAQRINNNNANASDLNSSQKDREHLSKVATRSSGAFYDVIDVMSLIEEIIIELNSHLPNEMRGSMQHMIHGLCQADMLLAGRLIKMHPISLLVVIMIFECASVLK